VIRILAVLPTIGIVAYMVVGRIQAFRLEVMRPFSLFLVLLMGPTVYLLRRRDRASVIEKTMFAYLVFAGAGFWLWSEGLGWILAAYPETLLYAFFFLAAAIPPLLGREPFTEHFARRRTPVEVRETEIYKSINLRMTWAWAGIFAACSLAALIPSIVSSLDTQLTGMLFRLALPMVFLLGVGLPLTKYYPDHYQRKLGLEPVRPNKQLPGLNSNSTGPFIPSPPTEDMMTDKRRVVAVNGSPHAEIGNTAMMLEMLQGPLAEEGFDLEIVHLAQHNIDYCVGCAMCLEKGKCWRPDDYAQLAARVLDAEGIILASPVYIMHVPAQMKAFLDRSLGFGHRPRPSWKPGLAVSVSAGMGESAVADYLAGGLAIFGAFSVGQLTAIATAPGGFLGEEAVQARAEDLARDLTRAIKEKRRYPATDRNLLFYQFMGDLIQRHKDFMKADYKHWQELGLFDGFESYVQQSFSQGRYDPGKSWIRDMISKEKKRGQGPGKTRKPPPSEVGPHAAKSCRELLKMMPLGFKPETAGDLKAIYQFEVTDGEDFTAHLQITDGRCTYHQGPAEKPDVTIKTPADVWLAIARGELSGQKAYFSGKYKAQGNIGLLIKLRSIF
jgi:multimeric flavodoxin WrbA/putative sterol carrier protein